MDEDDRAKISGLQTEFRKITGEYQYLVFANH
jgi:hypothetical protein